MSNIEISSEKDMEIYIDACVVCTKQINNYDFNNNYILECGHSIHKKCIKDIKEECGCGHLIDIHALIDIINDDLRNNIKKKKEYETRMKHYKDMINNIKNEIFGDGDVDIEIEFEKIKSEENEIKKRLISVVSKK